jgi:hypothetical protein
MFLEFNIYIYIYSWVSDAIALKSLIFAPFFYLICKPQSDKDLMVIKDKILF